MTATVEVLGTPTPDDLDDLVSLISLLGHSLDADVAGRVSAVAGAHVMWVYNADAPTAQLLLLVVSEEARRDGVGSYLLGHFEEWARGHGARTLDAVSAAATDSAHRFYRKRGYHEAGVRYSKLV